MWLRFPLGNDEATFQEKYGTQNSLEEFKDVFLQMGGQLRETCTVKMSGKSTSKKGWSIRIDCLPLHVAKQACQVVSNHIYSKEICISTKIIQIHFFLQLRRHDVSSVAAKTLFAMGKKSQECGQAGNIQICARKFIFIHMFDLNLYLCFIKETQHHLLSPKQLQQMGKPQVFIFDAFLCGKIVNCQMLTKNAGQSEVIGREVLLVQTNAQETEDEG